MRGAGAIWRALNAARRHNLASATEPTVRVAAAGATRRQLIAGLAAAAGTQIVPRPSFAAAPPRRVAIVGGGIAGLVALDRLVGAGIYATLFEARGALGGRIRTTVGVLGGGLAVDDGGQLVNSDHDDMRALCARFGLTLVDRQSAPSRGIVLERDAIVAPERIVSALRPLAARIVADADLIDRDTKASAAFDGMSVQSYLDRIGAGGLIRTLLESTIRTEYGVEPGEASALELLWNLPTVDGERFETLGGSDERYAVSGGSQRVTDALGRLHMNRIQLNRTLIRIAQGSSGVTLHFAGGQVEEADHVIVAVPAALYRSIRFDVRLPSIWRAFLSEIAPGRVEKLVIGCDRRPWLPVFGPAGELWSGPGFAEAWDATGGQPDLPGGAFAFLPGGAQIDTFEDEPAMALAAKWTNAAELAIPGLAKARNGYVRRTAWARDPFSRGAYVNYRPGQLTRFAPLLWTATGNPLAGRFGALSFVGEHLSAAFPGYMNGAAETGRQAADAVIAESLKASVA